MKLLIVTQVVDAADDLLGAFHRWIFRFSEVFESVEVVCLRKGAYDLPKNVRVRSLGKEERPSRPGAWQKALTRLRYLARFFRFVFGLRKDYDVVFVHMNPEYVVLAGIPWRLMGKTVFFWYAHKHGSWLRLVARSLAHRVVSVSKESFVGSDAPNFLPVGHGIDPDVFACPTGGREQGAGSRKEILSIGRLSPVKNYDQLLDAAHLLRTKYGRSDFTIRLVGAPAGPADGKYVEGLKRKIAEYGMTDVVSFPGPMANKDIVPVLCRAAIFVGMQGAGGAGKSFLEAMSCGVPTVVSTPVFNGLYGEWLSYLYFDGTPEDFALKLDRCLSLSDAERARMSAALRDIVVRNHNLKNLVRKLKAEYESLRARR